MTVYGVKANPYNMISCLNLVGTVCPARDSASDVSPFTLDTNLEKQLNDQINLEYEAFYLYEQLVS